MLSALSLNIPRVATGMLRQIFSFPRGNVYSIMNRAHDTLFQSRSMDQADALEEMVHLGDFSSKVDPFQLLLYRPSASYDTIEGSVLEFHPPHGQRKGQKVR